MKKTITLILSLVLLVGFATSAFADGAISKEVRDSFMKVDLDYLISYRDAINDIIAERGGEVKTGDTSTEEPEGEPFVPGIYEAGKSIKPGSYRFDFYDMNVGVVISLFESQDDYKNKVYKLSHSISTTNGSYILTLDEGNVLKIELVLGSGKIRINPLNASWAP